MIESRLLSALGVELTEHRVDGWVWVDLENTPHVLFLEPIIARLRDRGCEVRITAKPQGQTIELATSRGLAVTSVGSGDFAGTARKLLGGGARSIRLLWWVLRQSERPWLLLSSSRSASLAAWALRVPGIGLLDYEHTAQRPLVMGCVSLWAPSVLRDVTWPRTTRRVLRFFAGLKENLYLDQWQFERVGERRALGAGDDEYVIVARPSAPTAHYADAQSDHMWRAALGSLLKWERVRVVISPRNAQQRAELKRTLPTDSRIHILERVTPGPGLVAAADLVLGGGGTMNREAAVLGVPVWSTFCGPAPRVDEQLAAEGRLQWARSADELARVLSRGRPGRMSRRGPYSEGLGAILDDIVSRLESHRRGGVERSPLSRAQAARAT